MHADEGVGRVFESTCVARSSLQRTSGNGAVVEGLTQARDEGDCLSQRPICYGQTSSLAGTREHRFGWCRRLKLSTRQEAKVASPAETFLNAYVEAFWR